MAVKCMGFGPKENKDKFFIYTEVSGVKDPLVNIEAMREKRQLPWDEDFVGLATSLVTLQDTYALDLHELTKGHLHTEIPRNRTIPGLLPLNALDCVNLSQVALLHRFYYRAVEWAEQAIAKAAHEEPPTIPKQELDTHHKAVMTKVFNELVNTMGAVEHMPKYEVPVRDPTKHNGMYKEADFKRLCRGELLRTPKMDSQLRCRYYKGQDGLFALQPIKLEEVNLKPYIIVMHDVIQDRDIKDLISFAEPRLANYGIGGQYLPHTDYQQYSLHVN
ncbi:hypothetical protein HPB47_006165, partial [Ixodes persulcatus]